MLYYLVIINLISAIVFIIDKAVAGTNSRRVPEITLHFLELLGGVFAIIFLMFTIRHKNRKASYSFISFLILLIWVLILYLIWDTQLVIQIKNIV